MSKLRKTVNEMGLPDIIFPLDDEFVLDTTEQIFELLPPPSNHNPKNNATKKEKSFDSTNDEIPPIIAEFIDYGHRGFKIPFDGLIYRVHLGIYMRNDKMIIPAPKPDVLCRILFNYRYDEAYMLQIPLTPGEKGPPMTHKKAVVMANHCWLLGPEIMNSYQLYVGGNPHVDLTPSNRPMNIPKDLPNIPEFAKYRVQNKIRPRNYTRITVVVDYCGPEEKLNLVRKAMVGDTEGNPFEFLIKQLTNPETGLLKNLPRDKRGLTELLKQMKSEKKLPS